MIRLVSLQAIQFLRGDCPSDNIFDRDIACVLGWSWVDHNFCRYILFGSSENWMSLARFLDALIEILIRLSASSMQLFLE